MLMLMLVPILVLMLMLMLVLVPMLVHILMRYVFPFPDLQALTVSSAYCYGQVIYFVCALQPAFSVCSAVLWRRFRERDFLGSDF